MVTFDDFKKMDIRIGTILSAERIEGADKLLKLNVDIGTEKRQIIAGIATIINDPAELINKQLPILCNLAPRIIRGYESQGMILATSNNDQPVLIYPANEVTSGSQVS